MARIRALKPEAFSSETLANVSLGAERTFLGLSTQADDRGRFRWQPKVINGQLWAERGDHTADDLLAELVELGRQGAICRYTGCDGKLYGHFTNWDVHQKVDKPSRSRIPPCRQHQPAEECPKHDGLCPPPHEPTTSRDDTPKSNGTVVTTREPSRALATDLGSRTLDRGSRIVDQTPTAPLDAAARDDPAKWLTDRHYERMGRVISWPATRGIVRKFLTAGRDPTALDDALQRIAAEGRSLTLETLRIEIDGMPTPHRMNKAEQRTAGHLALVARLEAEERGETG